MLAIETNMNEVSREEASYANLECLVRSMRNLSLTIDQVASYLKDYESTKKLLDLYNNEEIIKVIEKHDASLEIIVD